VALDEVDVGFDAAEALLEGIDERTRVFVIIMGVGARERARAGSRVGG
jgi:hypothetical protein